MRLILILLILAVTAAGALFGAINGARVPVDLYFTAIEAPVGASLLVAALAGWLIGGLVAWLGLAPLKRRLRAARRELQTLRAQESSAGASDQA
jgi:uncharacterized integral membrane protein